MSQSYEAPERGEDVHLESWERDYPTDEDTTIVEFPEPDWSAAEPIPVYVVNPASAPEVKDWSSSRAYVTTQPVEVAGARRNRSRLFIRNEGPDDCYIGGDATTVSAGHSYKVGATNDRVIELWHNSSVFALCASGDEATLNIIDEYTVDMNDGD